MGSDFVAHPQYYKSEDFCGFTCVGVAGNHFCNHCGKEAALLVKKWDAANVVWSKYLCHTDYNKEVDKYLETIQPEETVIPEPSGNTTTN